MSERAQDFRVIACTAEGLAQAYADARMTPDNLTAASLYRMVSRLAGICADQAVALDTARGMLDQALAGAER